MGGGAQDGIASCDPAEYEMFDAQSIPQELQDRLRYKRGPVP